MALWVCLARPEFLFWTSGSYSVYTQPPPFDPASCIPSSGGSLWLRQGPFSPCRKKPKPTNPAIPLYSMDTSPTLTARLFDFRCTHRLGPPPRHPKGGGEPFARCWSRRRWHCVTTMKSEWVPSSEGVPKEPGGVVFREGGKGKEKGCVNGDVSSVNGAAGPVLRPLTVVEALQHPSPIVRFCSFPRTGRLFSGSIYQEA